jgi:hypothetical protein
MNEKHALNTSILNEFGNAICNGDVKIIGDLLSDKGVFEYQNEDLEIVSGVKEQFLSWILLRKVEYPKMEFEFTTFTCHYCLQNNGVLVFDGGNFPFIAYLKYLISKVGLAVQILESKIISVHFCLKVSDDFERQSFYENYFPEAHQLAAKTGNEVNSYFPEIALRVYGRKITTREDA